MSRILAQLVLPARGPNLEDWSDLLVVAIMAALWLAGALVKALSRKKTPEQAGLAKQQQRPPRESWQVRLARKAEEMQRAIEQGGVPRSSPASNARPPQPPGGRITVRQGPAGETVMVYERAAPPPVQPVAGPPPVRQSQAGEAVAAAGRAITKESAQVERKLEVKGPALEPIAEALPDLGVEPPQPSESDSPKTAESGGTAAAVLDASDADALRKAILHYEILGVPLGLREPFE